ncbi:MAG: ABC-F family ATP-binding cassette domain-containing protein [Myxococcota bacterium]|nr:ABC-F family ATP-binding cassette domain-containing protein [Myxococcota bacterium]
MISFQEIAKDFGGQVLFTDVNLQLNAGSRYGIVGANGSGKSTLMRMVSGEESPSSGRVTKPKSARIGMLEQDHFQYENTPIIEVVMQGNPILWKAMQDKEELLAKAHEEFDDARSSRLEDLIMQYDGYELESKAGQILEGLNIPSVLHQEPLSILSGGYKLRVLLGKALAADPEILLLDEPNNHLDILSICWLEEFLRSYKGCALIVSHDHRFLNNFTTHIIDVDYERATLYKGNYTAFVNAKAEERTRREAEIAKRKKEIADLDAFVTRFKAKASKARQANSKAKRMEKIVLEPLPQSSRRYPLFRLKARRPTGREVLSVDGVTKAFDDKIVLFDVSFKVERGEKVGIIGPNGIGKSTLLKILMDQLQADMGSSEWGYEVDCGYFPQDHHELLNKPKQTVKGYLWEAKATESMGFVHGKLAEVLFSRDEIEKKLDVLSGGEAARLLLCRIGVEEPTVLVLDEPTNHLDLEGIESLAKGLQDFEGAVIFVSHDRWFVDAVATRIIEINEDGVVDYPGTYSEYVARNEQANHLDAEAVAELEREKRRERKREKRREKQRDKKRKN